MELEDFINYVNPAGHLYRKRMAEIKRLRKDKKMLDYIERNHAGLRLWDGENWITVCSIRKMIRPLIHRQNTTAKRGKRSRQHDIPTQK